MTDSPHILTGQSRYNRFLILLVRSVHSWNEFCNYLSKYGFVAPLGSRLQGIPPASFRLFSQSCTRSRLCSERIGPNSSPVLKTRETQTGGPKMPSLEGCAFYPFFPISFDKYNWLLKKIHSARRYNLKAPISCRAVGWMILQHSRIVLPIVGNINSGTD